MGVFAIKSQTDATNIEIASIGLAVGAQTAYRIEQTRLAQARQAGQPLTDLQIASLHKEANAAGAAAQALAKLQITNQISRDRQGMFLSDTDLQIANSLVGIYPKIADALASPEAAAMRVNNQLKDMKDTAVSFAAALLILKDDSSAETKPPAKQEHAPRKERDVRVQYLKAA